MCWLMLYHVQFVFYCSEYFHILVMRNLSLSDYCQVRSLNIISHRSLIYDSKARINFSNESVEGIKQYKCH